MSVFGLVADAQLLILDSDTRNLSFSLPGLAVLLVSLQVLGIGYVMLAECITG